jgi:uncharacterized protein (TIGR03437 family)
VPGSVSFSINGSAATLVPGTYYATIQVSSPGTANSPQGYGIVLTITKASPIELDLAPSGLVFQTSAGSNPQPQTIAVTTPSQAPVPYQVGTNTNSGGAWLSVSPSIGSTVLGSAGQASVSVNTQGLAPGTYTGGVSFAAGTSGVQTVNVSLIIQSSGGGVSASLQAGSNANLLTPKAQCSPTALIPTQTGLVNSFSAPASWPTPLTIALADDCGNSVPNGQVIATFSNGDPPLAFNLSNSSQGLYSATWTPRSATAKVTINARATSPNLPAATAQIAGAVVPNAAPTITPNGVANPYNPEIGGALSPGTIVAIYGSNLASVAAQPSTTPLPTKLNGTSVLIGGIPSPLFYVSPGQINVQIPFELNPSQQYQIIVNANGALATPQPIQLTAATPGLDTFPDGTVVAVHAADGTLVSAASPAKQSEYVVLFLLGMGDTTDPVGSGNTSTGGSSVPTVAPTLTFNGNQVPVAFTGLAPGFVGLYQMNVQIPANLPGGNVVVSVSQGDASGNSAILPIAY